MSKRSYSFSSPYSPTPKRGNQNPFISQLVTPLAGAMAKSIGSQIGSSVINALSGGFSSSGTQTQTSNPTQQMTRRVRAQSGYLAGKVRPRKRTSKKMSYKVRKGKKRGKTRSTRLGLQSHGVHVTSELRWTTKTDTADKYESIQVGHNSMPTRTVLLCLCRAIIKQLFSKKQIMSFTDVVTGDPYNLSVGDVIDISYFPNYTSNAMSNATVAVVAGNTWEVIAMKLYTALTETINPTVMKNLRFHKIYYKPQGGSYNEPILKDLVTAQFEVNVKSALKIQNRTINTVGNDEADDVDNVPLTGFLYHLKGNNMWSRSFKSGLSCVGTGASASNDVVLYDSFTKSTGVLDAQADGEYIQTIAANSAFSKPSEPPKPYELFNCIKSTKIRMNPGSIKTSVLTQKYKLDFSYFIKLLLEDFNASTSLTQAYNPRKGFCRVFHLEKVIGSDTTSVSLGVENQFDIWARMITKPQGKYTGAIQIQTDIGVFP